MHRRHRFLIALSTLTAAALGLAVLASVPQRTAARPAQQRVVREALFEPVDHFGGAITGIAVAGHYAYIDRGRRLEVLDMTDPLAPRIIGRSALLPGLAQVAAVSDGQVYMVERVQTAAVQEDRLNVVDVTDPAAPRLRGTLGLGAVRLGLGSLILGPVVVRDGLLYGAAWKSGVVVLDVRDPDQPRYMATAATDLPAKGVAVDGDRLLVAVGSEILSGKGGLRVFQLADPTRPLLIGALDVGQDARAVAAAGPGGRYALLAAEEDLFVLDLVDPAAPRKAFQWPSGEGRRLIVNGSRAWLHRDTVFLNVDKYLALFDLTDLPLIKPMGEVHMPMLDSLAIMDEVAMVADGLWGLGVVGPGGPGDKALQLRHREPTIGAPAGIASDGIHAYVSDEDSEVWVLDLRDPAAPAVVGRADLENAKAGAEGEKRGGLGAAGLAFRNDTVYVACVASWDTSNGLHVVDVSDPRTPRQVGLWAWESELARHPELITEPLALNGYPPEISGERLWFTGAPLLTELDIRDPRAPRLVRKIDHPYPPNEFPIIPKRGSVAVADGRAWVAEPVTGLHLLDLSPTDAMRPITRTLTAGSPSDVMVAGAYTLVADGPGGLLVVDALSLATVGSLPQLRAERLVRAGDTVIVAGVVDVDRGEEHLRLSAVDISDPSLPVLRGSYDLPGVWTAWSGYTVDVAVVGDLFYVTADAEGIAILRMTDGAELPPPTVSPTLTPLPTDDPIQPPPSSTPAPGATATAVTGPTATAEGSGSGELGPLWLPMVWR